MNREDMVRLEKIGRMESLLDEAEWALEAAEQRYFLADDPKEMAHEAGRVAVLRQVRDTLVRALVEMRTAYGPDVYEDRAAFCMMYGGEIIA